MSRTPTAILIGARRGARTLAVFARRLSAAD
jgi:hypothetical protein